MLRLLPISCSDISRTCSSLGTGGMVRARTARLGAESGSERLADAGGVEGVDDELVLEELVDAGTGGTPSLAAVLGAI